MWMGVENVWFGKYIDWKSNLIEKQTTLTVVIIVELDVTFLVILGQYDK